MPAVEYGLVEYDEASTDRRIVDAQVTVERSKGGPSAVLIVPTTRRQARAYVRLARKRWLGPAAELAASVREGMSHGLSHGLDHGLQA